MLSVLWILLIIMLLFYVGGLSWGLVEIGAGEDVPAYVHIQHAHFCIWNLKGGKHHFPETGI